MWRLFGHLQYQKKVSGVGGVSSVFILEVRDYKPTMLSTYTHEWRRRPLTAPSEPLAGEESDLLWWRNFRKFIHIITFLNTDLKFFTPTSIFRLRNFWEHFPTHCWNFLLKFSHFKCFIPIFQLNNFGYQFSIYVFNCTKHSRQFSNSEFFTDTNFLTLTFRLLKCLAMIFHLRTSSLRPIFHTNFPIWNKKKLIFQQKNFPLKSNNI